MIAYRIPQNLVRKLQCIQNSDARMLSQTRKFDHIFPILRALHCLPVSALNEYKILLLPLKCIKGLSLQYLRECMPDYQPSRSLRSGSQCLPVVPRVKYCVCRQHLGFAGPYLYNQLPMEMRSLDSIAEFKHHLKTLLFTNHFCH